MGLVKRGKKQVALTLMAVVEAEAAKAASKAAKKEKGKVKAKA